MSYLRIGQSETGRQLPPVRLRDVLLHLESLLQPLPLQVGEDGSRPGLFPLPSDPRPDQVVVQGDGMAGNVVVAGRKGGGDGRGRVRVVVVVEEGGGSGGGVAGERGRENACQVNIIVYLTLSTSLQRTWVI